MENNNQNFATDVKQPINFRSENIANSKAKEKRDAFVNVQPERTIEKSVESIQQKYDNLKTNTKEAIIESRKETSDNPKKKINVHIIKKIIIYILTFTALSVGGYYVYYLIKDSQTITPLKASSYLKTNPDKFISMYDKMIDENSQAEIKVGLLFERINELRYNCGKEYAKQILEDAYMAHEIYPSYTTVNMLIEVEQEYGSGEKAKEWQDKLNDYRGIEIIFNYGNNG